MGKKQEASEEVVDTRPSYSELVTRLSGSKGKDLSSRTFNTPNFTVGVLHNPTKGTFSAYFQSRSFWVNRPYLKFTFDLSSLEEENHTFTRKLEAKNQLPLEKIVTKEKEGERQGNSRTLFDDSPEVRADEKELEFITWALHAINGRNNKGRIHRIRSDRKAEKKIHELITHLRINNKL